MYPPQGQGGLPPGGYLEIKHTELIEKEVNGIIDHADNSITSEKIRNGAITEDKLADDSVSTYKIKDNAITEPKLADNSVSTNKIKDNAITESKLADNSVSTDKIKDSAVTEPKLAFRCVSTGKIQNYAVTEDKLADNSVSTSKLKDGAVTTSKIADGAITTEKFSSAAIAPNSDKLDGYETSIAAAPSRIPVSNTAGKLAPEWLPTYFPDILSGFPPKPPGYSNYVVPYALSGTAATTLALTSGRTYWIPIVILFRVRITTVAINVTTASAGTHWVGIFDSTGEGYPRNRLIQWSFDTGTTGVKTSTAGLPIILEPGIYWIAWAAGSGATVRAIALASCRSLALPDMGTANLVCWYTSGSTLPATAPTSGYTALTGSALPAVGFMYDLTA